MVLAHPRMIFHSCMCGFHGGVAAVTAALIGYDHMEVAAEMSTTRRRSWSTTSSIPTCNYVGSLLQIFFHCPVRLVVMVHDSFTCKFFGCNSRCSDSVAYLLPYSGMRAVLRSFCLDQSLWWYVIVFRDWSWLWHVIKWLLHVLSLLCARYVPTS
jgi:hypothetical protein